MANEAVAHELMVVEKEKLQVMSLLSQIQGFFGPVNGVSLYLYSHHEGN
jgi:hypothetical protein